MKVSKYNAQKTLTKVWIFFLLGIALFLFLIIIANKNPENSGIVQNSEIVWSWYTKSTLPYISLILTSIFAINHNERNKNDIIDKLYFQLALGISLIYFLVILFFILGTQSNSASIIFEIMKGGKDYIMTFFQVFVTGILGFFFVSGESKE